MFPHLIVLNIGRLTEHFGNHAVFLLFSRVVAAELNQQRNEELFGVMKDVRGFLQRPEG